MITKTIKSNNGSTLVMVLMILSLLTMLGTATLSLGLTDFKMKVVDKHGKTSFYLAEAGIDEAYGLAVLELGQAIDLGSKEVALQKSQWSSLDPPTDGIINGWFQSQYINYLNTHFKNLLPTYPYGVLDSNLSSAKATITVDSWSMSDGTIIIHLSSTFIYKNVSETLKARFVIPIPEYDSNETKGGNILNLIHVTYYYN